MIIIQVSNIEGRRNAHIWRKSNHISIVVDLLSNLKWPILLVLQFVVGTNRKSLISKIDQHEIPNIENLLTLNLLTLLLISNLLVLDICSFKFLPHLFLHGLNTVSHILCCLTHS